MSQNASTLVGLIEGRFSSAAVIVPFNALPEAAESGALLAQVQAEFLGRRRSLVRGKKSEFFEGVA